MKYQDALPLVWWIILLKNNFKWSLLYNSLIWLEEQNATNNIDLSRYPGIQKLVFQKIKNFLFKDDFTKRAKLNVIIYHDGKLIFIDVPMN